MLPPSCRFRPCRHPGRVGKQHRDLPGVPVADGLRVFVQMAALGEGALQAGEVALEVVGHQHRHAGRFLDHVFERLQQYAPLTMCPPRRCRSRRWQAAGISWLCWLR